MSATPSKSVETVESVTTVESPYAENYALTADTLAGMSASAVREYADVQAAIVSDVFGRVMPLTTNRAAYATHAAVTAKLLTGTDGRGESVFSSAQWLARFGMDGKSVSLVSGWKTLGHALVVVGLDETDPVYVALRNSNMFGKGEVKDEVLREGATRESIAEVLSRFANLETGKRLDAKELAEVAKSTAVAALVADGKSEAEAEAAYAETLTTPNETPAKSTADETVETVVPRGNLPEYVGTVTRDLMSSAVALDADSWERLETTLRAWLDAENTRRAEVAAKPKPRAPRGK